MYKSLFVQYDHNLNGTVDLEEFKKETKQMMLAMAEGMGFLPVQMALEQDSILKKAVERETTTTFLNPWLIMNLLSVSQHKLTLTHYLFILFCAPINHVIFYNFITPHGNKLGGSDVAFFFF